LAQQTGYNERYLREWLECMAVGGYLEYEAATERFSLAPEQAIVLLDRDNPAYAVPFLCFIPSVANILTPLMEAFRSGGGVPFEAYGSDMIEAIGMGNRPMFVNDYVAKWISAMPDIETRLQAGGRVAEIGCGVGWASISLAQGFPNIQIDAVDVDAASIKKAQNNAQQAGVTDRIVFHLASAEEAPLTGSYDLVTAFEVIHDMAYPVKALRRMHELAAADGAVLIADEAVGESLEENRNFLGHLMYNFSVLHCLPQSMAYPGAAGTGTVMRPSILRDYAQEAGFTQVDVLPIENPFWRFYRLTP
jgi:2-polyprenyl-3-methyl-5-hydroxy-6-metoxy-1,4-benzoquinol methylase